MTDAAEESALLLRARKGEQRAFRQLYDRNVTSLYRFLRQFQKADAEAEEWTQRAFIKAFGALNRFDGRSRFRTWLFTIALNEMRADRRREAIVPFDGPDMLEDMHSPADGGMLEWNATLRTLLGELDETKRAVFLLYEVEGYSHAEIADMLSINESTSRTILTRTKQHLRERLQHQ